MSEEKALRLNQGKPEMGYIFHYPKAVEALVRVLEQGAVKYEHLNWKKGGKPDKEYIDSCSRHLFKHINEGPYDDDIGALHVAQAIWNLMTLIECNYPDIATLNPEFDQDEFVARYS